MRYNGSAHIRRVVFYCTINRPTTPIRIVCILDVGGGDCSRHVVSVAGLSLTDNSRVNLSKRRRSCRLRYIICYIIIIYYCVRIVCRADSHTRSNERKTPCRRRADRVRNEERSRWISAGEGTIPSKNNACWYRDEWAVVRAFF